MRTWIESSEIARLTRVGDWPSRETAALWKRFREEVLSGGTQKWRTQNSKRTLARNGHDAAVPPGIYRVEIDEPQGDALGMYSRLPTTNSIENSGQRFEA